jgi:hypothetical protein
MTTPTRKTDLPSLATAQAEVVRLRAEAARLRQISEGERRVETTRAEQRQVVRQSGAVEVVTEDVAVTETQATSALERLQARRALVDVQAALAEAEEVVEVARAAEDTAQRQRRAAAIAAGEAELRRVLPDLLTTVEHVQRQFVDFHQRLATLDSAVGGSPGYFTTLAACPLTGPEGFLHVWGERMRTSFGLRR